MHGSPSAHQTNLMTSPRPILRTVCPPNPPLAHDASSSPQTASPLSPYDVPPATTSVHAPPPPPLPSPLSSSSRRRGTSTAGRHLSNAAEADLPLVMLAGHVPHTPQGLSGLLFPSPPQQSPPPRTSAGRATAGASRHASANASARRISAVVATTNNSTKHNSSNYNNTAAAAAVREDGLLPLTGFHGSPNGSSTSQNEFHMAVPKDASRLLLHPLDAQRQHQLAFSLSDRDQQLEELDKQARLKMLRTQQERRLAWATASAAAVEDTLAVWDAVAAAVRDRRTSLQPDGYQTFSFPDGAAVYEGHWKNCHPHGKGCLRRSKPLNDVYEGQWFVGQRCGTGTYHNSAYQILYHGSWLDDKVHGKGELVEPEGVYTGEFVENTLHGYGEYVYNDGHVYKGDWVRGFYEGNGVYIYPSGTKYEGGWLRGCEHGRGTKWFSNGDIYMGEWMHGMPHGTGTLTSTCSTAIRVSGQWWYGSLNGTATCTFANGSYYTGEWRRGRFHGQGSFEVPCGNGEVQRYTGAFENGKRHGYGEYVSPSVSYAGQWVHDKKEGEGSLQVRGAGTYFGQWKADVPDGEGVYVATYRKGGHDEVQCAADDGTFTVCASQNEQQRVDMRLLGRP